MISVQAYLQNKRIINVKKKNILEEPCSDLKILFMKGTESRVVRTILSVGAFSVRESWSNVASLFTLSKWPNNISCSDYVNCTSSYIQDDLKMLVTAYAYS